jgi:hypothetical protein
MPILGVIASEGLAPGAPTIGTATAGDTSATVAYTAPAWPGKGSGAVTYTATSSPGSFTGTGSSPITVSGLTNGTAYTFTVKATTSYGVTGPSSAASNSITPASLTSYASIATVTGTGSNSTITFSSIPSTYKHLQIRGFGSLTGSSNDYFNQPFYVNGDNTANYARHGIRGAGTTPVATGTASSTRAYIYDCMPNFTNNQIYGSFVLDILDYADTNKLTTFRGFSGTDGNGAGGISYASSLWFSNAAINSITFEADAGKNYTQYTVFALYGIKG